VTHMIHYILYSRELNVEIHYKNYSYTPIASISSSYIEQYFYFLSMTKKRIISSVNILLLHRQVWRVTHERRTAFLNECNIFQNRDVRELTLIFFNDTIIHRKTVIIVSKKLIKFWKYYFYIISSTYSYKNTF